MPKIIFFIVILSIFPRALYAREINLPKWFPFSTESSLREWEEKILKGRVVYRIELKDKEGFVHARSDKTASGRYYKITFDPKTHPFISWKWKIERFPPKSKPTDLRDYKEDDFAARVYVIFPAFLFFNSKAIEYVWDEYLPDETISSSPYTSNIKLYVIKGSTNKIKTWVHEERNIYQDYIKLFGRPPALKVGAVAFMTDADSVNGIAEAEYDDISIGYDKPLHDKSPKPMKNLFPDLLKRNK